MRHVTVLLTKRADGQFLAILAPHVLEAARLDGFGARIERLIAQNTREDIEVEYSPSADITSGRPPCSVCLGIGEVEIEVTIAGQTLADEFSAIDRSKRATDTCPRCKGLCVEIPTFWQ